MTKDQTITFLRDGLQALGAYSAAFEPLLESVAMVVEVRDLAYTQLQQEGVVVDEISREGDSRKRTNPAWPIFIESSKELRALFVELKMTVRTATFTSGDEVDKLNILLQQVYDEAIKSRRSSGYQKRPRAKTTKR